MKTIRSLLLLTRVLAGRYRLNVQLTTHHTACTDGHTVFIPRAWTEGVVTDPNTAIIIEGALDHEAAGHARHTDFTVYGQYAKKSKFHSFLLNVLEDIRIETAACKLYPGVARNLAGMVECLAKKGFFGQVADVGKQSPKVELGNAILVVGRARLLYGQDKPLEKVMAACDQHMHATLGSLWPKIWAIVEKAPMADSTKSICCLCDEILQLLVDEKGLPGQSGRGATAVLGDNDDNLVKSGDLGSIVGEALEPDHKTGKIPGVDRVVFSGSYKAQPKAWPLPASWKAAAQRIAGRLGRDFESLLEARKENYSSIGVSGKRIDSSRLHRVKQMDARIFVTKHLEEGIDTVVTVIADGSISMRDALQGKVPMSRMDAAGGTMYALGDLLELHGIPFSAYVFDSGYSCVKSFADNWKQVKQMKEAVHQYGHSTIASPVLIDAINKMMDRQERKRLIVFVTDGDSTGMSAVRAAYEDAFHLGIDIATVLIANSSDSHVDSYRSITKKELFITNTMEGLASTIINSVRASI